MRTLSGQGLRQGCLGLRCTASQLIRCKVEILPCIIALKAEAIWAVFAVSFVSIASNVFLFHLMAVFVSIAMNFSIAVGSLLGASGVVAGASFFSPIRICDPFADVVNMGI